MKTAISSVHHPQQQGHIDGLCAVYAVLNACKLLLNHTEKQNEALFKALCQSIPDLFPNIVFDGTGVWGVYRLLRAATAHVAKKDRKTLVWRAALMRTSFSRVESYFDRLRSDLEAAEAGHRRAWIIGLNKPWDHWTVVRQVSPRQVVFYDSYGMGSYPVSSFTFNKKRAGDGKGQKIMIDQHQSFLVDIS